LENDPDLDARRLQPLGLGLDVGDVDRRDAPFLGLALGHEDLAGPLLVAGHVLVRVDLGQSERVPEEHAPGGQVADAVDDHHYSVRPGSSRKSFTVWRNSAATAPS